MAKAKRAKIREVRLLHDTVPDVKKKKKSILWKLVMAKEVSNLIMEEFTGTCICQFDWTSLCW